MLYLGIDPGIGGGMATLTDARQATAWPFDTIHAAMHELLQWVDYTDISNQRVFAMIESVHAFPKQGVTSTFKLGRNFGQWEGLLAGMGIPYEHVAPGTWQRKLGCLSRGNKQVTKAAAAKLYPQIMITHRIADALLIAEYCLRTRSQAYA